MVKKILYFGIKHAKNQHNIIIDKYGGFNPNDLNDGLKDKGLLESPLEMIKIDQYYSTFEDKLTHLVFSIIENHPFYDGNKRTAIALGSYFLKINNYDQFVIDDFIDKMEIISIMVASSIIKKDDLKEFLYFIINDIPFTEELSLTYIRGLNYNNKLQNNNGNE